MADNSMMGGRSNKNASPIDISKLLQGIDFPADKRKIEEYAEKHKDIASRDALDVIHRLPDRQYQSMADVEKNFNRRG